MRAIDILAEAKQVKNASPPCFLEVHIDILFSMCFVPFLFLGGLFWAAKNMFEILLVTKIVAMGAIEILAAGKVVKMMSKFDFPSLEGQTDCSYLI